MKNRRLSSLLLGSSLIVFTASAQAGDVIKANNIVALNVAGAPPTGSWVAGVVPTSTDVAVWNNTVTAPNVCALGGDLSWQGIKITNVAGTANPSATTAGIQITNGSSANTLTLGTAGIDMPAIAPAATQALLIQSKITLAEDYISTASNYMQGEMSEEAQLDELSGATLGSYVVKSKKDEKARKEHGIAVRDEIRKKTGLNVGTPMDPKLYGRKMSRGHNQQVAMKKLTGQARVNATEEVAVNSVGSGQVAGLQGEPPVRKKKKNVMTFNRFMKK